MALKVTVEVAVPPAVNVTGLGLKLTPRVGVVGVAVDERVTGPANPWTESVPDGRLPKVRVAVPVEPELNVTVEVLEVMLKS